MVATPAATPVTTPEEFTVAIPVLLLVHEKVPGPPDAVATKVVVPPTQIPCVPVIPVTLGAAFTVIDPVAVRVPPEQPAEGLRVSV
jgi:hypothetical protein